MPNPRDETVLVPAVDRAAAILRRLQEFSGDDQTSLSRIAEAIGINKSSCSYILRTLQQSALVELDPATKTYSLGPALIGLGAAAARRRDILKVGRKRMEGLVQRSGLTCLVFAQLANKSFVIIGKCESTKEIKVTIDVGQYFAPGTPALARLAMAGMKDFEAMAYLRRHCQTKFTSATKTAISEIKSEVASVCRDGFAISEGEYLAGNTVVAAPVVSPNEGGCRGICLIGFTSQMPVAELPKLGRLVKATADSITAALGGV
jgi:DNA-binding IclR family transcriptional regulator